MRPPSNRLQPPRRTRPRRRDATVIRLNGELGDRHDELAECEHALADLCHVREARPWTNYERASYARLCRTETRLRTALDHTRTALETATRTGRQLGTDT